MHGVIAELRHRLLATQLLGQRGRPDFQHILGQKQVVAPCLSMVPSVSRQSARANRSGSYRPISQPLERGIRVYPQARSAFARWYPVHILTPGQCPQRDDRRQLGEQFHTSDDTFLPSCSARPKLICCTVTNVKWCCN